MYFKFCNPLCVPSLHLVLLAPINKFQSSKRHFFIHTFIQIFLVCYLFFSRFILFFNSIEFFFFLNLICFYSIIEVSKHNAACCTVSVLYLIRITIVIGDVCFSVVGMFLFRSVVVYCQGWSYIFSILFRS